MHLKVNDLGDIFSEYLSVGNVSDQDPTGCDSLTRNLWGRLADEKGYFSQKSFDLLNARNVHLITKLIKNTNNMLVRMNDKLLPRNRWIIETTNDQLKNISRIEHTRH